MAADDKEPEKRPGGFGDTLRSLLFTSDAEEQPDMSGLGSGGVVDPSDVESLTAESGVIGGPETRVPRREIDVFTTPFGELYALTKTVGDEATDKLLAADARLAGKVPEVRAAALEATVAALAADVPAVTKTLAQRAEALSKLVAMKQRNVSDAQSKRKAELDEARTQTIAEVEKLNAQIKALEQKFTQEAQEASDAQARDLSSVQGFAARVVEEQRRLSALQEALTAQGVPVNE
ncbi:MAG: hypothetical protein Q7S96_03745 [bacterium]|nr:hypothetical protein [bacterium]